MATTDEREISQIVEQVKANPLNPEGWQALGKALGWKTTYCFNHKVKSSATRGCYFSRICDGVNFATWKYFALCYYDLLLTGGDVESFWKDLLKQQQ